MTTDMRVTRSMTRAMDDSAPKQESKKEKQPKKEMKVGIPKKESIIEFITEEELHSRNINKNNKKLFLFFLINISRNGRRS